MRTESRTRCEIFDNPQFQALSAYDQRLYWLLYSQREILLCGVIQFAIKRWVATSANDSQEQLLCALGRLETARLITVDHTTEEIFVNAFARWDHVCASAKSKLKAYGDLSAVHSDKLKAAAKERLEKEASDQEGKEKEAGERLELHKTEAYRSAAQSSQQGELPKSPGERPSHTVARKSNQESAGQRLLKNTEAGGRLKEEGRRFKSDTSDSYKDPNFVKFWTIYPRRVARAHAWQAWLAIVKKTDPSEVIAGAERYAQECTGQEQRYIAHPTTWLRGARWMDDPAQQPAVASKDAVSAKAWHEMITAFREVKGDGRAFHQTAWSDPHIAVVVKALGGYDGMNNEGKFLETKFRKTYAETVTSA